MKRHYEIHKQNKVAVKEVGALEETSSAPIQGLKQDGSQAVYIDKLSMIPAISSEPYWDSVGPGNCGSGGGFVNPRPIGEIGGSVRTCAKPGPC